MARREVHGYPHASHACPDDRSAPTTPRRAWLDCDVACGSAPPSHPPIGVEEERHDR
jgi:hypothetical protein